MMVEEEAVGGVEIGNRLHVLSIKFEVEEIQILLHSFLVNGLRMMITSLCNSQRKAT